MYKCSKCEGFIAELGELEPSNPCTCEADKIKSLERQLAEARELIKAVAHIGIDWGYGKFELSQDHIDKARELYEKLKEHCE